MFPLSIKNFLKERFHFYFLIVCICVSECGACAGQKRSLDPLAKARRRHVMVAARTEPTLALTH